MRRCCPPRARRPVHTLSIVAGHVYGTPKSAPGLHGPFRERLQWLQRHTTGIDLAVLTGDVVYYPSRRRYDALDSDLRRFGGDLEVAIAPGNHDFLEQMDDELWGFVNKTRLGPEESREGLMGAREWRQRYTGGGPIHRAFWRHGSLFVFLNPPLDGEQEAFLGAALRRARTPAAGQSGESAGGAANVFIFMHPHLWSAWAYNSMSWQRAASAARCAPVMGLGVRGERRLSLCPAKRAHKIRTGIVHARARPAQTPTQKRQGRRRCPRASCGPRPHTWQGSGLRGQVGTGFGRSLSRCCWKPRSRSTCLRAMWVTIPR